MVTTSLSTSTLQNHLGYFSPITFRMCTVSLILSLTGDETDSGALPATGIMRSYHNLHYNGNIKNKVKLTFGVDYGLQNNTEFTTDPSNFLAFLGTVRFILTKQSALTVRYEYFDDPSGFIGGGYFLNPMEERFSWIYYTRYHWRI